jgi:hypothetical protein
MGKRSFSFRDNSQTANAKVIFTIVGNERNLMEQTVAAIQQSVSIWWPDIGRSANPA